jgi:hypothetical protein
MKTAIDFTTPQAEYNAMINNPAFAKDACGEGFAWHAVFFMHRYLQGYKLSGDTAWLDAAVNYYDFLISRMATAPDGYRGWIGPYIYDANYWCDVHVGDAVLMRGVLDFAILVSGDQHLQSKYGAKARSYVDIARRDVVEKWDARGTWREDGEGGAYVGYDRYLRPGDLTAWCQSPDVKNSSLSLPFNKQNDMAQVCLRLWRITGEEFFLRRAELIFFRMKRCFQFFDDHYVWNYWEPFGPWDLDLAAGKTRHWVGVHPYRDYQAGEIHQIVDAFHCGIVFDEVDIQRIINTNLKVMWNGDRQNPHFLNSNATHTVLKDFPKGGHWNKVAGTLWDLEDFDQTIRDLRSARFRTQEKPSLERWYFEKITCGTPPGLARKYPRGAVHIPPIKFTVCRDINLAVALPGTVAPGGTTVLTSKCWKPGRLEVSLWDKAGTTPHAVLFTGEVPGGGEGLSGLHLFPWNGINPATGKRLPAGNYLARWTMGPDVRERPLVVGA